MNSFTEATNATTQFAKKISLEEYNKQKDDYTQRALRELKEQLTSSSKRPLDNKYSDIELDDDSDSDSNSNSVDVKNTSNNYYNDSSNEYNNDSNNDSNNDYNSNNIKQTKPKVNVFIQHIPEKIKNDNNGNNGNNGNSNNSNKKIKVNSQNNLQLNNNLVDSIYAKREDDINTIAKLNKQIVDLKQKNKELESTKRYLELDFLNKELDNTDKDRKIDELETTITISSRTIKTNEDNLKLKIKQDEENYKKNKFYLKLIKISMFILLMLNLYFDNFKYFLVFMFLIVAYKF
jgi:hypothetical protein